MRRIGACLLLSQILLVPIEARAEPPRVLDTRLKLDRFAAEPEIVTPVGIAVDGKGRVLVIESHTHFRPEGYAGPPADRIKIFEDRDGDGQAEQDRVYFEGSKWTMGIAPHPDGSLLVATRYEIFRLRDRDDDGRADERIRLAHLETPGTYPHNGLCGFALDFSGAVYFGLGENLGEAYSLKGADGITLSGGGEGGNIYRMKPDGSKLERVATGFWNPFGLGFDAFGRLFAVDNDPDSRPPCRLMHIVAGGDYGYRFRNGRKGIHPFTSWNGELPGTLPMVAGTGEAPGGVLAYESDHLPRDYQGNLLVTSWGDHRIERYRVQPRGASFRAVMEPVVVGGEDFRPVGIAQAPDGSVYVSDWVDKSYPLHGKGRIWHLRAAEPPGRSQPNSLAEALSHPDRRLREEAARALGNQPEILAKTLVEAPEARARTVALQALLAGNHDRAAMPASQDPSPDVRALAVRELPVSLLDLKTVAGKDESPLVRSEALRRLNDPTARDLFLAALESDDPFLVQAAREGLQRSLPIAEIVRLTEDPSAVHRLQAVLILRESNRPEAREPLPKLLGDPDPTVRFAAVQWVGEQGLATFRQALLDGLSRGGLTRSLVEGTLAALERLDNIKRGPRDERGGQDYVAAIVLDPNLPAVLRARALRVLSPDHPALTLKALESLIGSPDPSLRLEAVRTLRETAHPDRTRLLLDLARDTTLPEALRAEAVVGLNGQDARTRSFLVDLACSGPWSLRREALRSLRESPLSGDEESRITEAARGSADLAALVSTRQNPKRFPNPPPATDTDAWLRLLEGPADPQDGARIFYHPNGPGCFKCHQVDGRGGATGPELTTAGKSLERRRLVESIVQPGKEIAPQFVTWQIARQDGTIATGTYLGDTPDGEQLYSDEQGNRFTVRTSELAERRPLATSIMPEQLAHTMTLQEFRDLLAYLQHSQERQGPR